MSVATESPADPAARRRARRPHWGRGRTISTRSRSLTLTSREVSDLDMLASGALSPLTGFMGRDGLRACARRHAPRQAASPGHSPSAWPCPTHRRVTASRSPTRPGATLAVLEVEEVFDYDKEREAERCFRTTDTEHPGVARLFAQADRYVAGPVTVFDRVEPSFPELHKDPAETRALFTERGLEAGRRLPDQEPDPPRTRVPHEVRARDRRRPPHPPARRRDEVRRRAGRDPRRGLRRADRGLLPEGSRRRLELSRPPCATRGRGRRSGMRSAARTTAARTSSSGATTPASGATTARTTLSSSSTSSSPTSSDIEPMFFEHSFWCKVCGQMATQKTCPHGGDDHVFLSGTKVRELLVERRAASGGVLAAGGRGGADRGVPELVADAPRER